MGRIRAYIRVNGRKCWSLFDSGARNSFVVRSVVKPGDLKKLPGEREAALGGRKHRVKHGCLLLAKVESRSVDFDAWVLDRIGADEDGRPIEVIVGALAMQKWGIRLDLPNERLDMSHYSTHFVEF